MLGLVLFFAVAAFEPLSESPWLSGGAAAALFPRTHLSIPLNPSSIGLLQGTGLAVAASRPFGFKELDRTAAAGGVTGERYALGGFLSYSGRGGYSEATATAAGAAGLFPGAVGGVSLSIHRLSIEGFGGSTDLSADIGITARPITGLFLGASCRGLFSTSPANDGMGAVPRTVSVSSGVCPAEGVLISAGASVHQYSGEEFTLTTSVEPFPGINLSASLNSPPSRVGFAAEISVAPAALQYGYTTHPDLPAGHTVCLGYGNARFVPEPLFLQNGSDDTENGVSFPVNVNQATPAMLQEIPGIGPAKASAIVSHIETNGPLQSLDELVEVPGIGPATLERIRPYLTV